MINPIDRNYLRKHKALLLILLPLLLLTVGIFGYMWIEGWSIDDAFYMTVITLTTTGYGEVHPLSANGRLFTAFFLMVGVSLIAYSLATIIEIFFSVDWNEKRRKKMQKEIDQLYNHTIICGFGRMGKVICSELAKSNHAFVVIEKVDTCITEIEKEGYLAVHGDSTEDSILAKAGISRAKTLACMVDNDGDSLYMSLAARNLNPQIYIIARANAESAKKKIIKAGADKVILPYTTSALKVAQSVLYPNVEDFFDITGVKNDSDSRIQIFDVYITKESHLIGKSLKNCGFKREQLMVVGIRKRNEEFIFAPATSLPFEEGDCLITLGNKKNIDLLYQQNIGSKAAS